MPTRPRPFPPFRLHVPGAADRYTLAGFVTARHSVADPVAIAAAVRDRIAAAGWTITSYDVQPPYPHLETADPGVLFAGAYVSAHRDGLILNGRVDYTYDNGRYYLGDFSASVFAQRATAYLPLTVAGGLLGLVAGWLLVAALACRRRSLPALRRRAAPVLTGVAVLVAAPPVFAIARNAIQLAIHLRDTRFPVYTLHSVLEPGSWPDGTPTWLFPACAIAAAALGALAVAVGFTPVRRGGRRLKPAGPVEERTA